VNRRGFTLIEIVLSLALAALILVALNMFVFSMSELWGRNSDVRLFDRHVRAVTRYLEKELLRASLPPTAAVNSTPIAPLAITPAGRSKENLITYMVLSGGRALRWPGSPLPEVYCSLEVRRDEGLYMLWHSDLENHYNDDPPREALVSPFVTGMAYDYFDTDFNKWSTETEMKLDPTGNPMAPQRLRVTFGYNKLTQVALINLPRTSAGLPNPW
jgi:prepilin-type N-terminal cleavage/methylation domain-containing protein